MIRLTLTEEQIRDALREYVAKHYSGLACDFAVEELSIQGYRALDVTIRERGET